jgi:hypothetical protein
MSPRCLASALALAHRGLPVFPLHSVRPLPGGGFVCTCGKLSCGKASGKHPLGSLVPHGCKQASRDPRVIKHWWHCVDYANIGVATGDGLVVLDVDPRANGDQTLGDLEAKHGGLPRSWRVITGGGGEHIYFRSCAPIGCSASQIGPGLDVRARGGYVVAPPSLHLSGRQHCWSVDFHPDDVPLAPIPDWLTALIERPPSKQTPATEWRSLLRPASARDSPTPHWPGSPAICCATTSIRWSCSNFCSPRMQRAATRRCRTLKSRRSPTRSPGANWRGGKRDDRF